MNNRVYNTIKILAKFALFCYYKKITFLGLENLPKEGAVIMLPNHQNGLMDPLLIAVYSPRKPFFLTRADVFATKILKKFFAFLQMIPVYRLRDGRSSLANNKAIFKACRKLMRDGNVLVIFPEANHNIERRVRPLSKGFTRIVFQSLEKYPDRVINLQPVGINYRYPEGFPDSATYMFGQTFEAGPLYNRKDPNTSAIQLRNQVYNKIGGLTTHIEDEINYDKILEQLEDLEVDFLDPVRVNALVEKLPSRTIPARGKGGPNVLKHLMKFVFIVLNAPVLLIWYAGVKRLIPEIEFQSTFRFLYSLIIYPVYFLTLLIMLSSVFILSASAGIVLLIFGFNLLYVKFY